MNDETKKAVVLLSGGLDSATVLAVAKAESYELYALSFSYGQRHAWELEAATRVAASIGVAQHRIATIDLRAFGGSALTDDIDVPKGRGAGLPGVVATCGHGPEAKSAESYQSFAQALARFRAGSRARRNS